MRNKIFIASLLMFTLILMGCSEDPELGARVEINEVGSDFGGDVIGNGGSLKQSFTWSNSLTKVDWNMDITSVPKGSFNLRIEDSEGKIVLDETLMSGQGDDSKSGVSVAGLPGTWTITITLNDFNGDGSFSISPED